jgi:hypothetical protein
MLMTGPFLPLEKKEKTKLSQEVKSQVSLHAVKKVSQKNVGQKHSSI